MKIGIRLIALLLSLLLLCSCAGAEPTPSVTPAPVSISAPENWELYHGDMYEVVPACFELYELLYPGAYIDYSDYGVGRDGFEIRCYGPDMAALEASGIVPDKVKLNYTPNEFDPRPSHEVPREPESETSFDDGMTLRMERAVYPPYPEYVHYVMEADRDMVLGESIELYKYVDGEWSRCVKPSFATFGLGYGLKADTPVRGKLYHARWLGEGLYRIELEYGEYYVEFIVSADAEPLEPLPQEPEDTRKGYALNFFWQCELPENCTALKIPGEMEWPVEARSYSAEQSWPVSREEIAGKLLGREYSYSAETDTYTAGTRVLSFGEGSLSLTDSDPEVRAMKLAYPLVADPYGGGSGSCSMLNRVADLLTDSMNFDGVRAEVVPGVLNFALKDALEQKEAELPGEEFQKEYGGLADVFFEHGRSLSYCVSVPVMKDVVKTPCTRIDGGGVCGPELYCQVIDDEMREVTVSRMPGKITANDDAAPVITPYEAAAAVLPELYKIEGEFSLVAAEFSYAYHNGDMSTLRPTWVFTGEYTDSGEYLYLAVDALTGQLVGPHAEM